MVRLIPVALALVSLSFHEAGAATPTAELQAFFAEATRILTDPETDGKYAERLAAIRAITRQMLDVHEAARLSLGPAWKDRSEGEREEFALLYGDFLERAFIAWVASRAQIAGGPRVTFCGESVKGGQAIVRTTVVGRNGEDLPLEYRMRERGDRWAVFDVVIDRVSLAANYRAQFTRVIQASSYQDAGPAAPRQGAAGARDRRLVGASGAPDTHRARGGGLGDPGARAVTRDAAGRRAPRRARAIPGHHRGERVGRSIAAPSLLGAGRRVQELRDRRAPRLRPASGTTSGIGPLGRRHRSGPRPSPGCASAPSPTARRRRRACVRSSRAASNPSSPRRAETSR